MTALANSLQLLNEIREQLGTSKTPQGLGKAKSPAKPVNKSKSPRPFDQPKTPNKVIDTDRGAASYRVPITNGPDTYNTTLSTIMDEEPLRIELSRKALETLHHNQNLIDGQSSQTGRGGSTANMLGLSPPTLQKKRVEFVDENVPEPRMTASSSNLNVSPYKRRFIPKDQVNVNVEKISLRSNDLAESIKKMISKEIENFSRECDAVKEKIGRSAPSERQVILMERNHNAGRSHSPADDIYLRTTAKVSPKPAARNEVADTTMNSITRRMDKLMTDLEEKRTAAITLKPVPDNSGYKNQNYYKNEQQYTPTMGNEINFPTNTTLRSPNQDSYSFEAEKDYIKKY
jgi:hypothetical protein